MNKKLFLAAALLGGSFALPAHGAINGFTGIDVPDTWNTTINSTMLSLTSGNDQSPEPGNFVPACDGAVMGLPGNCQIRFVTTNILNNFAFDWSYASSDSAGAGDDLFGVLVDGARTQLSDPGGAIVQSGHVLVAATSSFGWYVNCTDCIEGAAVATITDFQAAVVPEPGVIALLGLGVIAGGLARARRSS